MNKVQTEAKLEALRSAPAIRNVYLVCYDVANHKRLRKADQKMRGFGDPMPYSVFRCELSPTEKQQMKQAPWETLDGKHDLVMVIHLGPAGARHDEGIQFWGEPRVELPDRVGRCRLVSRCERSGDAKNPGTAPKRNSL